MKKFFLLTTALCIGSIMMAETATLNIIEYAELNATIKLTESPYQMGVAPIVLTGTKGVSNEPVLNHNSKTGDDLRFYKGDQENTCTVTFATTDGSKMTKIEFRKDAETASNLNGEFTVDNGSLTDNIWTGSASSVTFSYNNTEANYKEQMYIINVTFDGIQPLKTLSSLTIDETPAQMTYRVGDAFSVNGLIVNAHFSDASVADVTTKVEWLVTPATFEEVSDAASVEVKATYKDKSITRTIENVIVEAKPIAPANGTIDIISFANLKDKVTLNTSTSPYQMGETSPISLTGIKGASNFPALNYNEAKGVDLRFYKSSNTNKSGVTFSVVEGKSITKIEFKKDAETASDLKGEFTVDSGSLTDNVWEGNATDVTFSYNNTESTFSEQMYIINVTYEDAATAISEVSLKNEATKIVENGQVIIIRNGVRYNAIGAVIE